jgi:hypothetical protein
MGPMGVEEPEEAAAVELVAAVASVSSESVVEGLDFEDGDDVVKIRRVEEERVV